MHAHPGPGTLGGAPELVELLDRVFIDSVPCARELMRLIHERGWTGWTRLERVQVVARA